MKRKIAETVSEDKRVKLQGNEKQSAGEIKSLDFKILKLSLKCPKFTLGALGKAADLRRPENERTPLSPQSIQELIFYALLKRKEFPAINTWFQCKHPNLIQCVSVTIVQGIDSSVIQNVQESSDVQPENDQAKVVSLLPQIGSKQLCQVEIIPPHQKQKDIVDDIMHIYTTKSYQMKAITKILKGEDPNIKVVPQKDELVNVEKTDKLDRTKLMLTQAEMKKHKYPLPGDQRNFLPLKSSYVPVTRHSPLFALDCENRGGKLSAIALVNEESQIIYYNVLNWSICNILPNRTEMSPTYDYEAELRSVKDDLNEILPPDAIIVGHSLQCDLSLLQACHPYCIDSATCYSIRSDGTTKLGVFAKIFLWKDVQAKTETHDPIEDAETSLALIKLKLSEDYSFGNVNRGGDISITRTAAEQMERNFEENYQSQLGTVLSARRKSGKPSYDLFKLITEFYGEINISTTKDLKKGRSVYDLSDQKIQWHLGKSMKKVFKHSQELIATKPFVFTHVDITDPSSEMEKLDEQLKKLYDAAPECSLHLTVFTGPHTSHQSNGFVMISTKSTNEIENLRAHRKTLLECS